MCRHLILPCLLPGLFCCGITNAQDSQKKLPREDVVEVPAVGKSLCVSNVFQTNMVLQRDKPVAIRIDWVHPHRGIVDLKTTADRLKPPGAACRRSKQTVTVCSAALGCFDGSRSLPKSLKLNTSTS